MCQAGAPASGPGVFPPREKAEGQQQDLRAGDGGEPGGEVEEPVQGVDVEQPGGQPAAQQRPAMPITQLMMRSCDLLLGASRLVSRPAARPRTIHAMMPMTDSSVSEEFDVRVAGLAR